MLIEITISLHIWLIYGTRRTSYYNVKHSGVQREGIYVIILVCHFISYYIALTL
jgi:hypothetical protein